MELKNKVAVVTGGSRGIGKATAEALLKEGCTVIICSKNPESLKKAEKELKVFGNVKAYQCDLADPESIKKFAAKLGKIDILVNNAGVAFYKKFSENTKDEIIETINVNVRGLILMAHCLAPKMEKDFIIINISSDAGKHGYPNMAAYCASKFAVVGFTEALAGEVGNKVVAICPGGVDTDMYVNMFGEHPRLKSEHIAAKILDVCKNPSKYKSGSAIEVYHVTDALNHLKLKYFRK